ncbi:MAG: methyltransferase domain-containing protein [Bacteroidetes bacterium]|nr:methyltransferase domain-containing protein [Bacteroidota bacterium]
MTKKAGKNYAEEYDKSWKKYDFIVNLYQLGRDTLHRRRALQLGGLKEGDTVLDLCCGTGLSFKAIQSIIGPKGKIIAIDINEHMLAVAKQRAADHGWTNIEFSSKPIEELQLTEQVDFAFFALCWYDKELSRGWIKSVSRFMDREKGRICFMDYKLPDNWLRPVIYPLLWIEIKWLGESYTIEELKWKPREVIGGMLRDAQYKAYFFDCLVAVAGKPL